MNATGRICLAAVFALASTFAMADSTPPGGVKIVDMKVPGSLTGMTGDPTEGAKIFKNRKLGNCLACHANEDMSNELFHGEVGPPLDGVADRWEPDQLRAILVDSKEVFGEQTIMPGFYTLNVGKNVRKDLVGKTILTAEQVEHIVAYLATLKE